MNVLQPTLPFTGRTRATREKSRRAAENAAPKAPTTKAHVYAWFEARGDRGGTDNELIRAMGILHGMKPNTPRARRRDLTKENRLEDSGAERDGCTVWRIRL